MTQLATTGDKQEVSLTKAGLDHTRDQLALLEQFVQDVLRKEQDYGIIPGTQKSSLWKPGALNVIAAFNCHVEPHCTHRATPGRPKAASTTARFSAIFW